MSCAPARIAGREVRALLFDYGHTLITYERPDHALLAAYTRIAERLHEAGLAQVPTAAVLLREVHDRIEAAVAAHEAAGHLEELDVVVEERRAYAESGLELSDALLDEVTHMVQQAWWLGILVPAPVIGVLGTLRDRGLRLGLCSNAPYRSRSLHGQLEHLGLVRLFDSVTFSSEVGWRKPSPRIFTAALSALGAEPASTAMVGDRRREDVAGARALGMVTVRIREHHDDSGVDDADVVIDRLSDLVALLIEDSRCVERGSVDVIAELANGPVT